MGDLSCLLKGQDQGVIYAGEEGALLQHSENPFLQRPATREYRKGTRGFCKGLAELLAQGWLKDVASLGSADVAPAKRGLSLWLHLCICTPAASSPSPPHPSGLCLLRLLLGEVARGTESAPLSRALCFWFRAGHCAFSVKTASVFSVSIQRLSLNCPCRYPAFFHFSGCDLLCRISP